MANMDLVSTTLDKYLKHRFNGNGELERTLNDKNGLPQTRSEDSPIKIYNISFDNMLPCCVALREDLHYIAAGFENSHIYLWKLNSNNTSLTSRNIKSQPNQHEQSPQSPPQAQHSNNQSNETSNDTDTIKIESISKLLAHSGSVYSIVFVNNNDLMLSCSEDTTIRLWCLKTKCNLIVYRGHNYPIWSLSIGSQGELFASASMDTTARLWRLDKMCPIRIFCGHDDDVECVQFHPNEKYIATGSSDATVRLWSTSDGKMVRLMVGHKKPITSLSFLPNGKFLASASSEGAIKVWNLETNSVTKDFSVPPAHTISFSPEQKFVSSCGIDNVLHLWRLCDDTSGLVEKKKLDFSGRSMRLIQSQFHMENKLFVVLR